MNDRASGRHRAPSRAITPFDSLSTSLSTAVGDRAGAIGRGGAVIAMSSGLVASVGFPAQAAPSTAAETGSIPVASPHQQVLSESSASASTSTTSMNTTAMLDSSSTNGMFSGVPVTAPSGATVDFERNTFTAIPKKVAPARSTTPRQTTSVSRSATRTATQSRSSTVQQTGTSATKQTSTSTKKSTSSSTTGSARGSSVLAVAARYVGVPYVYGGTSPRGMDCSGYVQYVFKQLGISLPRVAEDQRQATRQISRSSAQAGDLVFFLSGGSAYHVGVYAGNNMMYDAGRTGTGVAKREIWTSDVVFGRVIS